MRCISLHPKATPYLLDRQTSAFRSWSNLNRLARDFGPHKRELLFPLAKVFGEMFVSGGWTLLQKQQVLYSAPEFPKSDRGIVVRVCPKEKYIHQIRKFPPVLFVQVQCFFHGHLERLHRHCCGAITVGFVGVLGEYLLAQLVHFLVGHVDDQFSIQTDSVSVGEFVKLLQNCRVVGCLVNFVVRCACVGLSDLIISTCTYVCVYV